MSAARLSGWSAREASRGGSTSDSCGAWARERARPRRAIAVSARWIAVTLSSADPSGCSGSWPVMASPPRAGRAGPVSHRAYSCIMQLRLLGSLPPPSTPVTKDLMTTSASPRHLAGRPTAIPAPTASSSAPVAGSRTATTSRLLQQVTPAVSRLRTFGDIGRHLLIPLFLATGMALAYLGAFHQPTPHALPTAVVGTSVEAKVFAQQLNDASDGALTV